MEPKIENPSPCTPSELSVFLSGLAASADAPHKARLLQAADHFERLANDPPQYATIAQKEEIKRLCQHPLLDKGTKTKTLIAHVRYNYDEAADCIRRLQSMLSILEDMRQAA